MNGKRGLGRGPEVHGVLAYLSRPLYPLLRRVHVKRRGPRGHAPKDILLPDGYTAEVVATGLTTAVHCTFGPDGACYVTEAGYKAEQRPRILRVDVATGDITTFYELPEERWFKTGAMTGACWHEGALYVADTDTLFRIRADGRAEDVVTGLPGRGDHQANYPVVGPDSKLYFTVGTSTNTGVVGPDNFTTSGSDTSRTCTTSRGRMSCLRDATTSRRTCARAATSRAASRPARSSRTGRRRTTAR